MLHIGPVRKRYQFYFCQRHLILHTQHAHRYNNPLHAGSVAVQFSTSINRLVLPLENHVNARTCAE